jgi:uncharacterized glyoxalase superfamily protein PhnB
MLANRSIPPSTIIPELAYEDVGKAAEWLCKAFGFAERLRIASHRIQLTFGEGSIVVIERRNGSASDASDFHHSVMVRVDDAHRHCEHAKQHGAVILHPPADYPFGERQYTAEDLGGHRWTFSQTIADVDPKDWGGVLVGATLPGHGRARTGTDEQGRKR